MKAILVLDEMPKGCVCCPCSDDEDHFCRAKSEYYYSLGRPSWCPLKELPQKRYTSFDPETIDGEPLSVLTVYYEGWNECIEELEK